jgi:hypothetical protein
MVYRKTGVVKRRTDGMDGTAVRAADAVRVTRPGPYRIIAPSRRRRNSLVLIPHE